MDPGRALVDTNLRLNHRHGDAWHPMAEVPGTQAGPEVEVERQWRSGRIFRCEQCDQQIQIESGPAEGFG